MCGVRREDGEPCGGNNKGEQCLSDKCGQYGKDDHFCCSSLVQGILDNFCKELADGVGCEMHAQCRSGWCESASKTCTATNANGVSCNLPTDSEGDASCTSNKCGRYGSASDKRCCFKQGLFGTIYNWCEEVADEEACEYHGQCASGWCFADTKLCKATLANGEDCEYGTGLTPALDKACSSGTCGRHRDDQFRCCASTSLLGTVKDWCTNLPSDNTCELNGQCESGWCGRGVDQVGEVLCQATVANGEECSQAQNDFECTSNKCGYYADDETRCCTTSSLLGTVLQWCTGLAVGSGCKHHGQCHEGYCANSFLCAPTRAVGDGCTIDHHCTSGLCGRIDDDKLSDVDKFCCSDRGLLGTTFEWCKNLDIDDACKHDGQCKTQYCKGPLGSRQCTAKKADGAICSSDNRECESNACGQFADGDYVCCASKAKLGTIYDWCINLAVDDGCKHDGQCASGWCGAGQCKETKQNFDLSGCGANNHCASQSCGLYDQSNNFGDKFCCPDTGALGTTRIWCLDLPLENNCEHHGQCSSDYCHDGNKKCTEKLLIDDTCTKTYSDKQCASDKCGQSADDVYICCTKMGGLGTLFQWCLVWYIACVFQPHMPISISNTAVL